MFKHKESDISSKGQQIKRVYKYINKVGFVHLVHIDFNRFIE